MDQLPGLLAYKIIAVLGWLALLGVGNDPVHVAGGHTTRILLDGLGRRRLHEQHGDLAAFALLERGEFGFERGGLFAGKSTGEIVDS